MRSLSSSMARKLSRSAVGELREDASGGLLQRGPTAHGGRELTVDLRPRLRRIAGRKTVQHLAEIVLGEVFIGVFPDQDHRRVHAGAEALDLFPAEIAVLGEVKRIMMDPAPAHLDDVFGAAQPAWHGAADLDMRLLADRRQ